MNARLFCASAVLTLACQRQPAPAASAKPAAPPGPVDEGRTLLEQGQLDGALARLQAAPSDPDALYYQGMVWVRKAESAPLPTPAPASGDPRRHDPPRVPEFKAEELQALELFGKAIALRPAHAGAELAIAELLAPHAARHHAAPPAGPHKRPVRGKPTEPPPPAEGEPDYRPERVVAAYRAAIQADPTSKAPVEGLIRFALRVGRLDDAQSGFDEIVRRDKENPEPLVRYGDFLMSQKNDRQAAIEAYRQALIWRPDDEATRSKLADIYIGMGMEHFAKSEYSSAEVRFAEAEKYITDRGSPQALKIRDHQSRLREIRRPTGR